MEANCKYFCKICNFSTNKKGNWNSHIVTQKHLSNKNEKMYICKCGLQYKHMSSLCKHKKKCNNNADIENNDSSDSDINIDDNDIDKKQLSIMKMNADIISFNFPVLAVIFLIFLGEPLFIKS